jgi:uncharacterized protein YdhG (YjbR/CyaY superfamily)
VTESFSKEEKAAMRAAAAERRRKFTPEQHAAEVLENYQAMDPADREIGLRIHEIVMAAAPQLAPKTWYGMPAYYKDGKNICFFQAAGKDKNTCIFHFRDHCTGKWTTSLVPFSRMIPNPLLIEIDNVIGHVKILGLEKRK